MKFLREEFFDGDSLEINITPLIDVVFILLIFFMVTTTFDENAGLQVQLPKAEQRRAAEQNAELLTVTITRGGELHIAGKQMSLPDLEKRLRDYAAASPHATLILRADAGTTHGRVVQVMDLAKRLGVSKLAIATEPPADS